MYLNVFNFIVFPSGWGPDLIPPPPSSEGPALLRPALSPAPLRQHPYLRQETRIHTQRHTKRRCRETEQATEQEKCEENHTSPHRGGALCYTKPPTSGCPSLFKQDITAAILRRSH